MVISATRQAFIRTFLAATAAGWLAMAPTATFGQGSRKDDIVLSPSGHPIAGATIRVCQSGATGTPCSPLATIYTDATMAVGAPNPFQSDGIGNYHFYAPAGRYLLQITGPGITGTRAYPDVILAPDVSSSGAGNNISAFGLTLGGNLTVAGNATIDGTETLAGVTGSTQCLHVSTLGVVSGTGLDCGSGGSGTPGGSDTQAQINAAGAFGAVSGLGVDSSSSPTKWTVPFSEQVKGPRPRTDVTAYGAKGDGSTDDTAAIQAAINAVCAENGNVKSTLFFPPGRYVVSQPQGGSAVTGPVFTGLCSQLLIEGSGGNETAQFATAPTSAIVTTAGGNPGSGPVFELAYPNDNGSTFKNISIHGYNQAVYLVAGNGITFDNVGLYAQTTTYADNVPLKMSQVLGVSWKGGTIGAGAGSGDDVLIIGADTGGVTAQDPDIIYFDGIGGNFWVGSGIHVDGRVSFITGPGNLHFKNILIEDATQPIFRVTNSGGGSFLNMSDVELENFSASDGTSTVVVNFNVSTATLTGFHAKGIGTGANAPPVVIQAGAISSCDIRNGGLGLDNSSLVVDGSGNILGNCSVESQNGLISEITAGNERLRSDLGDGASGSSLEGFLAGKAFASLNIDPAAGLMFGDGSSYGYSAQIFQATKETVDVAFPSWMPPTNVTGSATTGGSLAAGTYYYFVRGTSATNASSCGAANMSAPSLASNGVVLSGANNAVSLTWTASPAGAATQNGYCIYRAAGPGFSDGAQYPGLYASGASTTSFTDTGSGSVCCNLVAPYNPMQSVHRFTATSLGVNTANPQFNLDVNGTAAVNSLNSVQKAERFPGVDAAAEINACLTAASTSSGVCDARGLTGTLTASSHITIPAATTLMWGQAHLTINDNTTKDAVELGGDGASLIGYQETGQGTVSRPDTSGYIACGVVGCTTVDNPNASTTNVDWVHIERMALVASGASSKVINLTSVGHASVRDNQLTLGTGGGGYGIFGDTSTGDNDSTNDLIRHNQINLESQNDTCVYLAGIYNINVLEMNSCYLSAANTGQEGFVYSKDSNGNYPNNSQVWGNDCEQGGSSNSFGVICFDIRGAQDITLGPNNRCEHVYNCFQFPSDGSAVGVHLFDPYLSISNTVQIKPNEPQAAQYAVDNNGHNWQPSQHFGFNDLAGQNLLGNAGFEGWQNSTTLYYWGGVSGTNINQPGSSIYSRQSSATAPADSYTQGSYSVVIGDNATPGLGINSGCIQLDATMEYTMAFRVASTSTGVKFRPGFRFYSDPNCTEANRITNTSANARVLAPADYAGQSALLGVGNNPNWKSTNASLTYNNGITCNCDVTGADWSVAAANTWYPNRNFAITFRVPNAYSSSSTVAQSMRVFILENTAANPNQIYVDDIALSQGPVSPYVPSPANLADSGNGGTVNAYSSYNFEGNLTLQSNTGFGGTFTHTNTANRTYTLPDASGIVALQTPLASWGLQHAGSAQSFSSNAVKVWGLIIPYEVTFSHIDYNVATLDSSTSDNYDVGLYGPCPVNTASCPLVSHIGAQNLTSTGYKQASVTAATIQPGVYWIAISGNATTAQVSTTSVSEWTVCPSTNSSTTSSGGALPSTIATPNCSAPQWTGAAVVTIGLE